MDKCRAPLTKSEILKDKLRLFWRHPKTIFMSKKKRSEYIMNRSKQSQEESRKRRELEMKNLENWMKYKARLEAKEILLKKGLKIYPRPPHGEKPENLDEIIEIRKRDGNWDWRVKKILDQYKKYYNKKGITF